MNTAKEQAFGLMREFDGLTGQRARDWSDFEGLAEEMMRLNPSGAERDDDPLDIAEPREILRALDNTITGEVERNVNDVRGGYNAAYLRMLLELQIRVRQALI